jgi:hypothetical protein
MKRSKNKKQDVGGRPYKWASGKTKTIRVPVAFLKQVLAFINELDRREQQRKAWEASMPFIKSECPDPPWGK